MCFTNALHCKKNASRSVIPKMGGMFPQLAQSYCSGVKAKLFLVATVCNLHKIVISLITVMC